MVFSEMHLFPSHYWREEGGGGGLDGGGLVVAEGELLLICPMQCQHLTNFMQPFKLLLLFGSSVLPARSPAERAHAQEQVNGNELQAFLSG